MIKAYEYRIYPTLQQEELFNKTLGLYPSSSSIELNNF